MSHDGRLKMELLSEIRASHPVVEEQGIGSISLR